ncbi:uncharacterized protein LOC107360955 [Tetranychus urticae]|uniref:Uncharacterized protein n=1 Tax=Tetranychus urticae TaxID=32264 RepID=T1K7N2_TETUR|nr:uncharacterized protein LOC107360955 [Tetranychus urticae]
MINLANKVALITGSSDGIGAATALLFSSLGAKVAIVGRDQIKLDKVAAECESKSPHHYKPVVIKADFVRDEDVIRTFEETISAYKTLDILVNNCGLASQKKFGEPDAISDYDRVQQINVRAVVRLTELAAPHLKETNGSIVNVSSIAAIRPNPGSWSYCMSKAALDMFTKCMAGKLAPHVRVNSVNPGGTRTNFFSSLADPDAVLSSLVQKNPLKRIAEPIDIANTIAFLASDAARNMTGSIVLSDTGLLVADPYAK